MEIPAYKWLARTSAAFLLEAFVFISGYLFAFQRITLNRKTSFGALVANKLKRLMLPSIIFSAVYFAIFFQYKGVGNLVYSIINGCGHMWFLPMLFWCFIAIWLIDHFKLNSWWLLGVLAIVSLMPPRSLPLGFSRLPHFVFYVYGGYFLWTQRDCLFEHCLSWKWIVALWTVYVAFVIVDHAFLPDYKVYAGTMKAFVLGLDKMVDLLMAVCGVMALYLTVCHYTNQSGFKPKPWVIAASDNCYGVYVYHQFVLTLLYFFTPFVSFIHPLVVPWLGFAIIMTVSLLLTWLTLKSKTGRLLIG